ncbi:MAG: ParB/RepB/Spo0J family partition protein [Gammaproteobacteria bacterium]|nr:MAG: ParB/RepB/Spo0J family partition protein [Gammaproteobacteria bacterium]
MAGKKRGLGRGLDALLSVSVDLPDHENALRSLPVDLLQRGRYQPRTDMHTDTLEDLAASIRVQGVVQPIVVRPLPGSNQFEIIVGERRWRAAQMAGLHEVPALVRDVPDEAAIAMALIENIQREDLNPIEEARALSRLIGEFEMTHERAAEAIGRSRTAVTNLLRLLELDEHVKTYLEKGDLEMGHARALLSLKHSEQQSVASRVASLGLSVRETERLVKRMQSDKKKPPTRRLKDPNIRHLEEQLAEKLGARVTIEHGQRGGKLVVRYGSLDELEGILAHIR